MNQCPLGFIFALAIFASGMTYFSFMQVSKQQELAPSGTSSSQENLPGEPLKTASLNPTANRSPSQSRPLSSESQREIQSLGFARTLRLSCKERNKKISLDSKVKMARLKIEACGKSSPDVNFNNGSTRASVFTLRKSFSTEWVQIQPGSSLISVKDSSDSKERVIVIQREG